MSRTGTAQTSSQNKQQKKPGLHARNPHKTAYDFPKLVALLPELSSFIYVTPRQQESINFSDPLAVKTLNRALLKQFYGVEFWDIPEGYLCPAIPGRADYIHYIADLLAPLNKGTAPRGKKISVLDIGTGANCVYPIIGSQSYDWSFIASDVNPVSINISQQIIKMNRNLSGKVRCRLQPHTESIFQNIIQPNDLFDLTMCNPPFHASEKEATSGTLRKVKNLNKGKKDQSEKPIGKPELNFGGQSAELWCDGGEIAFLYNMIDESAAFSGQCLWFTSLVSKKENLPQVYSRLEKVKAKQVHTLNMTQGQKISRVVAWSFLDKKDQAFWAQNRWAK